MAICLSRNIRSCSTFALVGRRSQHLSPFDLKPSYFGGPLVKEMTFLDHSLKSSRNNVPNSSAMINFQVFAHSVNCAQKCKAYKKVPNELDDNLRRADKNQLQYVTNVLIQDLPELFRRNMNFKIYHPNMVFENNIRGTKTVGVANYMREIFLLKVIGNIRFSCVKFKILKITDHPEDGTVRVRWRIVGVSQFKNILRMIKQVSQKHSEPEGWYDGFSIFYVRSDGLIHRHIVDKMIPENYQGENISKLRDPLAAKMAFAVDASRKDILFTTALFNETHDNPSCLFKVTYSLKVHGSFLEIKLCDSALVNKLNQYS